MLRHLNGQMVVGVGGEKRADPKMETEGPIEVIVSKPSTNSEMILKTRQASAVKLCSELVFKSVIGNNLFS